MPFRGKRAWDRLPSPFLDSFYAGKQLSATQLDTFYAQGKIRVHATGSVSCSIPRIILSELQPLEQGERNQASCRARFLIFTWVTARGMAVRRKSNKRLNPLPESASPACTWFAQGGRSSIREPEKRKGENHEESGGCDCGGGTVHRPGSGIRVCSATGFVFSSRLVLSMAWPDGNPRGDFCPPAHGTDRNGGPGMALRWQGVAERQERDGQGNGNDAAGRCHSLRSQPAVSFSIAFPLRHRQANPEGGRMLPSARSIQTPAFITMRSKLKNSARSRPR